MNARDDIIDGFRNVWSPVISRCRLPLLAGLSLLMIGGVATGVAWTGDPSPLDDGHLVLSRPPALLTMAGDSPETVQDAHAVFGDRLAVMPDDGLTASIEVRYAGEYDVWIRVGQAGEPRIPIQASLSHEGQMVLETTFHDDRGDVRRGGPEGYGAYATQARETDPDGRRREGVAEFGMAATDALAADLGDELMAELGGEEVRAARWVNVTRLEAVNPARPLYWWRLGRVTLQPGAHRLTLTPAGERPMDDRRIRVDTAMLTTYPHLQYPFSGDINAPRASYVRFRLDGPFESGQGLSISGHVMHHRHPSYSSRAVFDPRELDPVENSQPHRETGYTRWYRLNDIEDVPGIGGHHISLSLSLSGNAGRAGATQFAVYPHGDYVLREIPWDEPDGMRISMLLDFERHADRLRTFRDHARDNYHLALRATSQRVFPLTRGPLHFSNAWGQAPGAAREYMVKTLRLLGFNAASAGDARANQHRYGWYGSGGHYWPPSWMPFDPETTAARYDNHYRNYFEGKDEQYERIVGFQIADEPGEIQRNIMSAPLWRYRPHDEGDGVWRDLAGNGELHTRRVDYENSVLEGTVSLQGDVIGFRAAVTDFETMERQAYWSIGSINRNAPDINVLAGRDRERGQPMTRRGARIGNAPTSFRIVHHGDRVALFINDTLIHQHQGVEPAGGFGLYGNPKGVHALTIRPMRTDESLHPEQPSTSMDPRTAERDRLDAMLDLDGLLTELDAPPPEPDAPPPEPMGLREFVEQHWKIAGGIPEAHEGFRRWLQSQGRQPRDFDAQSWDEVRMLTIRNAIETPNDQRLYYWSRRYSGLLTPLMFRQAADAIHRHAPNPDMRGFVALSGHALYFPSAMPLDMFALAEGGHHLLPGVSDWMSQSGWRWDSHQAVAFSVAPYNAGGRISGSTERLSFPMMHCVWPSVFRGYTMLANQVKYISYWNYGPSYAVTEGYWSDSFGSHQAVHTVNNRAAQVDDILADAVMRPSRVAMLYARATEYWHAQSSFADKRAAFLVMSHEGYQPELVTEEQVLEDGLDAYDALVVLEPWVRSEAAGRIVDWTHQGGLLIAAANAMTRDEYNEAADVLHARFDLRREFRDADDPAPSGEARTFSPVDGSPGFRSHAVHAASRVAGVSWPEARVLGRYGDAVPGWLDAPVGDGRLVYLGHRPGLTATAQAVRLGGQEVVWADAGRDPLVRPLLDAGVVRELIVSEPVIVASPLSTAAGTVIILYNMRPASFDNLEVVLREPVEPYSVQRFDGFDLVDIETTYRDGKVHMLLPLGWAEGQMIVVRREPPPPDDRLPQLREHARDLLQSDDWADRSAGLWFMGMFPEWQAVETLRTHLRDDRWEIRRVAAEGLRRAHDGETADALVAALTEETDVHVRVEILETLAALGDERILALGLDAATDDHPLVKLAALNGLAAGLADTTIPSSQAAGLTALLRASIPSGDSRIRSAALALIEHVDEAGRRELAAAFESDRMTQVLLATAAAGSPRETVARLIDLYERDPAAAETPVATALGNDSELRAAFLERSEPVPFDLLLAVARRQRDSGVADALRQRLDEVTDAARLRQAAMRQRDPGLTRAIFDRAGNEPYDMGGYMALILEHTFDARQGNSLAAWRVWLDEN